MDNEGLKKAQKEMGEEIDAALKNYQLRQHLQPIFDQVSARMCQYVNLGSSQQCDHAKKEVIMRVPKSLHYGNSDALYFRIHATAAFINEVRW